MNDVTYMYHIIFDEVGYLQKITLMLQTLLITTVNTPM